MNCYCTQCGKQLQYPYRFCSNCGARNNAIDYNIVEPTTINRELVESSGKRMFRDYLIRAVGMLLTTICSFLIAYFGNLTIPYNSIFIVVLILIPYSFIYTLRACIIYKNIKKNTFKVIKVRVKRVSQNITTSGYGRERKVVFILTGKIKILFSRGLSTKLNLSPDLGAYDGQLYYIIAFPSRLFPNIYLRKLYYFYSCPLDAELTENYEDFSYLEN